jgi:hypothetical protein
MSKTFSITDGRGKISLSVCLSQEISLNIIKAVLKKMLQNN